MNTYRFKLGGLVPNVVIASVDIIADTIEEAVRILKENLKEVIPAHTGDERVASFLISFNGDKISEKNCIMVTETRAVLKD